jgi:Spy/CpxP family protein refolding chaperone
MDAMKALVCLLLLAAAPAAAQSPPQPPQPPPGEDPIAQRVFPPELIMGHQKEIGLDDKQRAAIVKEIQTAQSQILEVQWQMQGAVEEMVKLLDAPRVDEQKTLAQADQEIEPSSAQIGQAHAEDREQRERGKKHAADCSQRVQPVEETDAAGERGPAAYERADQDRQGRPHQ